MVCVNVCDDDYISCTLQTLLVRIRSNRSTSTDLFFHTFIRWVYATFSWNQILGHDLFSNNSCDKTISGTVDDAIHGTVINTFTPLQFGLVESHKMVECSDQRQTVIWCVLKV